MGPGTRPDPARRVGHTGQRQALWERLVLGVFIAGLMVGRTPELLGKTIGRHEIPLAALYTLVTPALVLVLSGLAVVLPWRRADCSRTVPTA
ncbi:MAG: hypothetical protein NVSMB32_19090 [Actinomycetota bacterium]